MESLRPTAGPPLFLVSPGELTVQVVTLLLLGYLQYLFTP